MSAPLLTRLLDPPFAIFIGLSAAWVRIQREETERASAADLPAPTHTDTLKVLQTRLGKVDRNPAHWMQGANENQGKKKGWSVSESEADVSGGRR